MNYVVLPGTDLRLSRICLGTIGFGTSISRDEASGLMDAFRDAGGNFLDTAHVYADWQSQIPGMSERTIGEWISSRGCRDQVVVATKGGHPILGTTSPRLSKEQLFDDVKESLRRLQVEQIDLYWLHRDDESVPVDQILDTLEEIRCEGLIRWYAASNWSTARLKEAAVCAKRRRIPGMVASQIRWSLAKFNPERVADRTMVEMDTPSYQFYRETGMPVAAYGPQAGGFFGGNYWRDRPESGQAEVRRSYDLEINWGRLERARELGSKLKCSANQIALAYLVSQPFVTMPIVGCRRLDQIADSCDAAELVLSPEQMNYLENGDMGI